MPRPVGVHPAPGNGAGRQQRLGSGPDIEYLAGRLVGLRRLVLTVGHPGGFKGEDHFGQVQVRAGQPLDAADFIHGQEGEQGQKPGDIPVVGVDPELEVVVGGCAVGVQPDGALGGFPHLGPACWW